MDLVDCFWSRSEKTVVNPKMHQKSKITLLTDFLDVVNRVFSLSELFAVRDLSVVLFGQYMEFYSRYKHDSFEDM